MSSFLVIITVFLSTQSQFTNSPNSLLSLLSANNERRKDAVFHKSNILRLAEDVVISSSIQIRSEEIMLIGNSSKLIFQRDNQPSSEQSSWSPNEASTKVEKKNTPKVGCDGLSATSFMFEVVNSTLSMSDVHAVMISERNGICSIAGSTVRFSSSSITSNGDLSPFMITTSENEGPTFGSTIILADVAHHSMSGHVAPFVGVTQPQHPLVSPHAVKRGDSETSQAEWITIVGTGLWLNSQNLIGGTGPLFSFGVSEQGSSLGASACGLRTESSLVGSTLVNMTSSSRMSLDHQLFGSEVRQLVVGRCVAESTNHDSGTGMMSPHLGGNVMCLNTSFSSCIRTGNNDTDFQNKNFTQTDLGRYALDSTSEITSVTFTICTFKDMTVTGYDSSGSAIFLSDSSSSLSINTCFFHNCTCMRIDDTGGAIRFNCVTSRKRPFTLTHSSFSNCSAGDKGGSLYLFNPSSISIDHCFFDNSTALADGAALLDSEVVTVSNTAFVNCSSEWRGGAITFVDTPTLSLTFYVTVTIDNNEATVVVETEEEISGTMSILLDGSNVPRLVHVVFGDSKTASQLGTAVVTSGENGILHNAPYTHRASTLAHVPPPTVRIVESELKDWNTTEIVVKGVSFGEGNYWMEVEKEGKTWNITLSRSNPATLTGTAPLYPSTATGRLEWETEYNVTKVMWLTEDGQTEEEVNLSDAITFTTPIESPRIEKVANRILNAARTELVVSLEGRKLQANLGFLSLSAESGSWTSIGGIEEDDDTHCTVRFLTGDAENTTHIKFGKEYTLMTVSTDENNFVVNDGIKITVPSPPKITKMEFSFSNALHTGCFVVLTGTNLFVGNSLKITLNDSLSFIATITSETEARSAELQIGWPTTLQHNSKYQLTLIEAMNEADGSTLFDTSISNTTGSLPDDIVIFVDSDSTSESSLFCGDRVRPCTSIEDGWKIVEGVEITTFSISILHTTTQTEQVKILSQHEVVIESGPSTKPELFVSPSLSLSKLDGEGMVDVCGGRLWIHQVDIALSDSAWLIFIRMVGGDLTIELCSLVGPKGTPTINNIESSTDLCEWGTGVLNLVNSTTTITSTQLTHLSLGAINMKGGNLTIRSSSFDSNNPHSSSFPSLRHNIRCSEEGEIEIGSLNGGDGMETPSAWISASDCSLTAKEAISRSPFFIPTLSSSSTSKLNKKEKAFIVTIEGTTLIPCSLILEVFEKKKDGTDGERKPFPLTEDSTTSFNDTSMIVSLALSSLSLLDDSLEWRARECVGEKIASSEGEHEVVASSRDLSLRLVCVCDCVIVCCRRRRLQKNEQKETEMTDSVPLAMEDEKVEIVTDNRIGVNSVQPFSSSESNKVTEKKEKLEQSDDEIGFQNVEEVLVCSGDLKKTAIVSKNRTLFNALHSEKKWDVRVRQAQQQLVSGLKGVLKKDREAAILRALTAHNILFDSNENVCLKLNLDVAPHMPLSAYTQNPTEGNQAQQEQEPTVETNESKQNGPQLAEPVNEGVRWFAPEVISNKSNVNSVHGAVFSLGLILWEMETGCVPFAEHDAVNASRQIVTGVQPKLDLVSNKEMRELISQCLCLEPVDRPDLDTIESTLAFIPTDNSTPIPSTRHNFLLDEDNTPAGSLIILFESSSTHLHDTLSSFVTAHKCLSSTS
ncbi:hypothetical protein BLNAU_10169 [Blattamonas nauphoetae]|uniref:Protein kinase domain-containing protein n=1 Tax=Blattamonas nauphoetae TaxID=2049346 RepID=A0ABQ9XTN0_9EUKA|nr:hypothetical protein BLNAU_10169 [Blattamonas nauphoetae]